MSVSHVQSEESIAFQCGDAVPQRPSTEYAYGGL